MVQQFFRWIKNKGFSAREYTETQNVEYFTAKIVFA